MRSAMRRLADEGAGLRLTSTARFAVFVAAGALTTLRLPADFDTRQVVYVVPRTFLPLQLAFDDVA
jgi:hypothetical protein